MSTSGSFATATLTIAGMSCGHCAAAVEKALLAIPGVSQAQVNLDKQQAVITYVAGEVIPAMLKDAVQKAGYTFAGADLG